MLRRLFSYVTPVDKYEFSTHLLEEFTEYESRFDDHIEWVSIEQNVLKIKQPCVGCVLIERRSVTSRYHGSTISG